jgi:serine-type D-Ala-D-Ala carboxypeptidase/endopeptidase (penicillin-binding protein 4)
MNSRYRLSTLSLSHRTTVIAGAAIVLLVALTAWLYPRTSEASTSAETAALRNTIAQILDNPERPGAHWGVYIQNLRTGEVVFSRNADQSMLPASNQKVVTVAVALNALGADHRFATRLYHEGSAADSTLRGDLIVRGSGDPTFGSMLSGRDPLARWARELHGMGVRRIEGRLIGDAGAMVPQPYAAGWDIDYIATADWAQASGGLSYADNLVTIQMAGTRAGDAASVTAQPEGYVEFRGNLNTRGGRGFGPLSVERVVGTNVISLSGAVSAGYRGAVRLPIHDPTMFTMHAFAERLRRAGIEVAAEIIDAAELEARPAYQSDPVFVHHSPPLIDILAIINQRSNNFYAEQVFRAISANGSPRGAAQRTMSYLQGAGVPTAGLSVRDGSGLSRKNLITPETMGRLLAYLYTSEYRDAYLSTLPRGGQPNTTMRFRLGGAPVWAKTGTIEHVRGLSGYVLGPDRTPYAFALIANNFTTSPAMISVVQNDIIMALAGQAGRR